MPKALGMDTHRFGHSYPCTWSWLPMYVGTSNHVRGHNGCISFDISLVLYAISLVLYAICRFFMILRKRLRVYTLHNSKKAVTAD